MEDPEGGGQEEALLRKRVWEQVQETNGPQKRQERKDGVEDTGLTSEEAERNTEEADTILHPGAAEGAYIVKSPNRACSIKPSWAAIPF